MAKRLIVIFTALLCGLVACAPARTQPEKTSELEQLQARLDTSEKKVAQLSQQVALLQTMVDRQERDLQGKTGALSEQVEQLDSLPPSQPSPVAEATSPVDDIPGAENIHPVEKPQAAPQEITSPSAGPDETDAKLSEPSPPLDDDIPAGIPASIAYQEAMDILQEGDYETASNRFKAFASRFPDDDLADNALYWAGECNYTRKKFTEAIDLFTEVVEKYPSGSKVPDALLKIGYAYISLGAKDTAATYLKQVIAKYPFSSAGAKAEERLDSLR